MPDQAVVHPDDPLVFTNNVAWIEPPPPKKKRKFKSAMTHAGWTNITDLETTAKRGDVICTDWHTPRGYSDDGRYTEYKFHRGNCGGYEVSEDTIGHPFSIFQLKQEGGDRMRGYIWRPDQVKRKLKLNPIYSKPHPFFSR